MHFKILGITMKIGKTQIGKGMPCFVIAEAGVNHNGEIKIAMRLVDAAVSACADAIKFQIFDSEELVTKKANVAGYAEKNIGKGGSQLEMLKKLELKKQDFIELKKYCAKKGIIFLCTPHSSAKDVDFLESIGIEAYKIGSGDLTNRGFLEFVAEKQKPVFLSTGMATLEETKQAVKAIIRTGNKKLVVLHCTTNYPCPAEEANLRVIPELGKKLGFPVGFSDHTLSTTLPAVAVALGACVIEKHFTLSRKMQGPDHKASLEPDELQKAVKNIRETEKALGNGKKKPTKSELKIRDSVRKSIVAAENIGKGAKITEKMISVKRPGTGLSPEKICFVIGKKAKRKIKKDDFIFLRDLQ